MPAPTYQGVYSNNTRSTTSTSVSVTGCAVGDTLVAFQIGDYFGSTTSLVAPSAATGIGTWTAVTAGVKGGDVYGRAWQAQVTTAGTRTVTMTRPSIANSFNTVHVMRLSGVDPTQPLDGTSTSFGTTGTSLSLPSITAVTPDARMFGVWGGLTFANNLTTITKPASMTLLAGASVRDGSQAYVVSASQQLAAAGATGTRVATATSTPDVGWVGLLVNISGVRFIPIPVTDTGTGSDSITVAKTLVSSQAEPATATDPVVVFNDRAPVTDTGTSSDFCYIDVLTPKSASDSATGSDPVAVAFFIGNDLAEPALGSDPITMDRLRFVPATDSATGSDISSLRQDKTPTDAAFETETVGGVAFPGLFEFGIGVDDPTVLDIPYTQVVRRDRASAPAVYDLVVMARIPQTGGPPLLLEVDPIEWKTLSFTNELNSAQELTATAQLSSITENVMARLARPYELATEFRLYRNGTIVFAGPLLGWQTSEETLTVKAGGLLTYLKMMVVPTDVVFTAADQVAIVKSIVDSWQAGEFGSFGIDTSSMTASGVPRSVTFKRSELSNVFTKTEELSKLDNGFDMEIDPASRKLSLWTPRKGIDRSSGEDAIVFDDRNITSSDIICSVAVGDLASEAYGSGTATGVDTPFFSMKANPELRSKYGRVAVTGSFNNVFNQAEVDGDTQALLDARKDALMVPGPNVRVTPDASIVDYDVGDTVAYDLGGSIPIQGAFRIRKQTIAASPQTGQETVDLEFV